MVKGISFIPVGEHAFDTEVIGDIKHPLNARKTKNKADVLYSLDLLQKKHPDLKAVNVHVGWFGDSLDPAKIKITPKVEHTKDYDKGVWSVGNLKRADVAQVSVDSKKVVNWGGTPSDHSVINLVNELNSRGLKVMVSPIINMDMPNKPWPGYIKMNNAGDLGNFFEQYTKLVMHYATLNYNGVALKDRIEAISIGTELKGLTSNKDFIIKFKDLAKQVKEAVGVKVKVTYSANWAEYHHDDEGYREIDELWASESIDLVGINAYFPLTREISQKDITKDVIKKGWSEGLNCDYYLNNGVENFDLSQDWALKHIAHWWDTYHEDIMGKQTGWEPKMKPLIFTNFGFGCKSLYDISDAYEKCLDPVKKAAKDTAINATEEYWTEQSQLDDNADLAAIRYLHAWDLRQIVEV